MEISSIKELQAHDELSAFFVDVFRTKPRVSTPLSSLLTFVEGLSGIVLIREGQFQVQLFLVAPNVEIPDHCHPNVDSYEVAISGMQFRQEGEIILPHWWAVDPRSVGQCIRVNPCDIHGATAGPLGGSFLSVQHWLNDVAPTTVGNDWSGSTMGPQHDQEILSI